MGFIYNKYINYIRKTACKKKLKILTNKNPTIICNNCISGIIYSDLGLQFKSPTINLYFTEQDFIRYISHLEEYSKTTLVEELEELEESSSFPVGVLRNKHGAVRLYFMHYSSFEEAKEKWVERTSRIDYNNIYIIMDGGISCPTEILDQFEAITFPNKVILTNGVVNYSSSFPMSFYDKKFFEGKILTYRSRFSSKRYLDEFDYVKFLNSGDISV